ncbi:hypothetical protein HK105_205427 [Polyrhizophydium stewartii]|uniref:Ankyrin repeat protein n=1 Tax=Polyrhizophydium stewartii TaxID=2732419 RepID=A0ABR4N6J9_9FUNG
MISHWDRLPLELRDMVLEAAGALTLLAAGRAVDIARLPRSVRVRMWVDVVETEFQGDLALLAPASGGASLAPPVEAFMAVRSRAMLERLQALPACNGEFVLFSAARNGWLDLLEGCNPRVRMQILAKSGALDLVRREACACANAADDASECCPRCGCIRLCAAHAEMAARYGHLELLQLLHATMDPSTRWTTSVLDNAAASGHLDVVQWLHLHRSDGCSTDAMDLAAWAGRLDIVRFLHTHRSEGCTTEAMNLSAKQGNLRMVMWLHAHRTEGCTNEAFDLAARSGHERVVKWLLDHRAERPSDAALIGAAERGHAGVVACLLGANSAGRDGSRLFSSRCLRAALAKARSGGRTAICDLIGLSLVGDAAR